MKKLQAQCSLERHLAMSLSSPPPMIPNLPFRPPHTVPGQHSDDVTSGMRCYRHCGCCLAGCWISHPA